MTQEEKELLLRDLSARLTYGVIVDYKEDEYDFHHWKISTLHAPAYSQSGSLINTDSDGWIEYEEYKGCGMSSGSRPLHLEITRPFLRPISSMTKEEIHGFQEILGPDIEVGYGFMDILVSSIHTFSFNELQALFDWLNAHHFDYRGLIEKGLAIAVTEDNNPYK